MRTLLVALTLVGCSPAHAPLPPPKYVQDAPIPRFAKVRDGLYRGGRPKEAGLDYLASLGVKTIVDLEVADVVEAKPADIDAEKRGAAQRGIAWINAPMSAFEPALSRRFDEQMDRVLSVLADAEAQPVYVHCLHGEDRTGLVVGLERVLVESWTPDRAYAEMIRNGFHPTFAGLDAYFKRKSGYR